MTKQNLEIKEFEEKITKAGKRYTRFNTDDGWMSCFDKKTCEALKEEEGNIVSCEISEQNGFKNIKKFLGESEDSDEEEEKPAKEKVSVGIKPAFNQASMYVSYAKDIFVASVNFAKEIKMSINEEDAKKIMKNAVELVKIAKEAFEDKPVEPPKPKRNFKKEIVMLLQKCEDGIETSALCFELKATEEDINAEVKNLLEQGICYEPKPGKIKFLG